MGPQVDALLGGYPFALDRFQHDAVAALEAGRSVLVSAPTGSGKTVVADYAVARALDEGGRAFYTTPIKALSNQKFGDLRARHGVGRVGLLTGDNSIDGDAPVVVMTTEVLRNMIYAGRDLRTLSVVVLDEVHYLQDTFRGPVWEEVIVHLPEHVQLVCLSATVSNAGDIGDWLTTVRGPTDVVVEDRRPVTLDHTYLVGDKSTERAHLLPILVDGRPNPEGDRFDQAGGRDRQGGGGRRGGRPGRPRQRWYTPNRLEVLDVLRSADLLPAIVFIFSRAACDDAARQMLDAGIRLTEPDERLRIRLIAEAAVEQLSDADLDVLGYPRWLAALEAGIAAHHAGHVPPFKEAVEACFAEGLVKLVFATETLALGINMPARAVVIERMTKFNGERREFLNPGQYTQLTGRAGRRGIDEHGTAIALWSPFVPFGQIAGLASSRSFVLRSAFRPTYNMAANLVRRHEPDEAHRLLNQSLAQYQADRAVVVLERRRADRERALQAAEAAARCERGDVAELRDLLGGPAAAPGDGGRVTIADHLARLKPGDVIAVPDEPRAAVLSVAYRKGGSVRVKAVTPDRRVVLLGPDDFDDAPDTVGAIELPTPFQPDDHEFRREVASRLSRARTGGARAERRRRRSLEVDHPVASCPDAANHLRALDRSERLRRDVADLTHQVTRRTGTLGRQFDQVCKVLEDWRYLDGWSLTARGELLAGVYHEADLLVAEAVATGLFDDLDAPELAAVASGLVYEHRSPGPPPAADYPSRRVHERLQRLDGIGNRLNRAEDRAGLPPTRMPEHGFAWAAHEWCAGTPLSRILEDADLELTGGDFVRTVRQLVDLVRQLAHLAPSATTRATAGRAAEALERGVVSASSSLEDEEEAGDDDVELPEVAAAADPAEVGPAEGQVAGGAPAPGEGIR